MPYSTQIKQGSRNNLPYVISEEPSGSAKSVFVHCDGLVIGYMQYTVCKHSLYIRNMNNNTAKWEEPYKNVGTLLFEHAFKESFKLQGE